MASQLLRTLFTTSNAVLKHASRFWSKVYYTSMLGSAEGAFDVDLSVEIRNPLQIKVSDNCLIKKHTILNGRSNSKEFGISLGPGTHIKENCYIDAYDGFIEIKGNTTLGQFCVVTGHGGVFIGEYVMIGPFSYIIPSNHNFESLELPYMYQGTRDLGAVIEDNVWIGGGSIILGGVRVGRNSVIGAGTVVAKDVPPNSVLVNKLTPRIVRLLHHREDQRIDYE